MINQQPKPTLLGRFLNRVYLGAACLSGLCLITLCLLVLWSILARLLGQYSSGTTDIAGYFMAASTFLALGYTFRQNGHIRVEILLERVSSNILDYTCLLIMALVTSYLAFYLSKLSFDSWQYEERSEGADNLLLWIPQLFIAIGAIIFCISVYHSIAEIIFKKRHRK